MKKKEINGGIVMKCFKRLTACIIATALCVSSSGTIFALSDNDKKDISDKFSDYLLEKYNVSRNDIRNLNVSKDTEKVPVIVWCKNDIDHDAATREAIPELLKDMSDQYVLRDLSVVTQTSLPDIIRPDTKVSAAAIQNFIETEREVSSRMYEELNLKFSEKYMSDMEVTYISRYSPVVIAKLSLDEVIELAERMKQ